MQEVPTKLYNPNQVSIFVGTTTSKNMTDIMIFLAIEIHFYWVLISNFKT